MEKFKDYLALLDNAAKAPDDIFPDMLFEPMTNDYGDNYFELDFEDFGNDAVKADPRFTVQSLNRLAPKIARFDLYLEASALYEDYITYLENKHGSIDLYLDKLECGDTNDPPLTRLKQYQPPILKHKEQRKMLASGVIPAFLPHGYAEIDEIRAFVAMLDRTDEEFSKLEGTEDDSARELKMNRKTSKALRERNSIQAVSHRQALLASGTSSHIGIHSGSNYDFMDHYYADVGNGVYDTKFSNPNQVRQSMVDGMREIFDEQFMTPMEIQLREERRTTTAGNYQRLWSNGNHISARGTYSDTEMDVLKHLISEFPNSRAAAAIGRTGDKYGRQAVRSQLSNAGIQIPLSKKEIKRERKRRDKILRSQDQSTRGHAHLSEVLLNNKVFASGGTIRFEDMRHREDEWR